MPQGVTSGYPKHRLQINTPDSLAAADRVLAERASITLHQLDDLTGCGAVLAQSRTRTEASLVQSEPLLRIALLRAELTARLGDRTKGQAIVDKLLATCRNSPPRFQVLGALTGLSLGGDPTPVHYLQALVDALGKVRPDTARLALIGALERCVPIHDLPEALVEQFLGLIPDLSDPTLAPRDRAVMSLRRVEALRLVGRRADAEVVLATARDHLLHPAEGGDAAKPTSFPLPELLRAEDRLSRQMEACQRAKDQLPSFAVEFSGDQERVLVTTAWVDQAERALFNSNEPALDEAIAETKRRLDNLEVPGTDHLNARIFRVRAQAAGQRRFDDDETRFLATARKYEEKLGIPARPAPARGAGSAGSAEASVHASAEVDFHVTAFAEATVAPPPLLPVHAVYTIALGWKTDEGLSVMTRPPSALGRTVVLGFWFLDKLGLGRVPTPAGTVASVPMWPVTGFQEQWRAL